MTLAVPPTGPGVLKFISSCSTPSTPFFATIWRETGIDASDRVTSHGFAAPSGLERYAVRFGEADDAGAA
jgi:hypothetical protein